MVSQLRENTAESWALRAQLEERRHLSATKELQDLQATIRSLLQQPDGTPIGDQVARVIMARLTPQQLRQIMGIATC